MAKIPRVSHLWSLEFEVIALGDQGPNYSNLIHVTNGENNGSPGNRYPGVFVEQGRQRLMINSYVNNNANYGYYSPEEISRENWSKVKIQQFERDAKIIYKVEINDMTVVEVENTTPAEFYDMTFYAADPWHAQQANVTLKNMVYRRYYTCNYFDSFVNPYDKLV